MKIVPYLIILIVITSLSVNIFLLFHPVYQKKYIHQVNIVTGICLWLNLILLVISKRHLKKKQSEHVHKIFSKN
jgi:hypothetical protein